MKTCVLLLGLLLALSCRTNEPTPTTLPACIQTIIQQNGRLNTNLSVTAITRYKYQNRYVYFALSDCCDLHDMLFDSSCQTLCSPSGGFSGGGDGRCPNFFKEATEEAEIWQRTR